MTSFFLNSFIFNLIGITFLKVDAKYILVKAGREHLKAKFIKSNNVYETFVHNIKRNSGLRTSCCNNIATSIC